MTPARNLEADRVEVMYYWALNRLGNAMAVDALQLYQDNISIQNASRNSTWLATLLRMLFGFMDPARRLAVAYYRLVRALRTGSAPTYGDEQPGETTLEALRQEFESVVDEIIRETEDVSSEDLDLPGDERIPDFDPEELTDLDATVELEFVTNIIDLQAERDRRAEQEALDVLDQLGISNLTKNADKVKGDDKRDDKLAKVYDIANARQAAMAMRIMMNAARGLTYDLADTDLKVLGWARYSRSGNPCHFCAVLISRGAMYKTRAAALAKEDADGARETGVDISDTNKYHPNCRCVAVPVFLPTQYDSSELFDQNREYRRLWDQHVKGKPDAMNLWRSYLKYGFPGEQQVAA